MHGASLTPQKSGDEKKLKKYGQARGEKSKKCEGGVFHKCSKSKYHFFHLPMLGELRKLHAKIYTFSVKIDREINFQS